MLASDGRHFHTAKILIRGGAAVPAGGGGREGATAVHLSVKYDYIVVTTSFGECRSKRWSNVFKMRNHTPSPSVGARVLTHHDGAHAGWRQRGSPYDQRSDSTIPCSRVRPAESGEDFTTFRCKPHDNNMQRIFTSGRGKRKRSRGYDIVRELIKNAGIEGSGISGGGVNLL